MTPVTPVPWVPGATGWSDPVPQAGSYSLATLFDKSVTMSFTRVDADTIKVTVAGSKRDFSFTVSKAGAITAD